MQPTQHELWGKLDLGGRCVPLYTVDEIALAAGEAPRSVDVAHACGACGFVHQHTSEAVCHSHDHDRVNKYEITYVASIAVTCARCCTPMRLDLFFDVTGHHLQPGITLSLYTALARNTRPASSRRRSDGG